MARTSEEKHTTVGGIAGVVYQYYVFLYYLLTMKRGEVVSFEKLDDTAKETPNFIALHQAKYTVKYGIDGEETPLTNRAQDFWKAIDVWLDLIKTDGDKKRTKEEQVRYINTHKFHFVTNKVPINNGFYKLCQKNKEEVDLHTIDSVLDAITAEGRNSGKKGCHGNYRSVQEIIDDLKAYELRREFISNIEFETESLDSLKTKCLEYLTDTVRFTEDESKQVFDDFKIEVDKDFVEHLKQGKPLEYSFVFQKKRFQRVFQLHRTENLNFKIVKERFRPDFLNLVCIQQLMKVNDLKPSDTDRVAEKTCHYLSFKNKYQNMHDNYEILVPEEQMFNEEVMTAWNNEFQYAYIDTDETTPEKDIVRRAAGLLRDIRKTDLTLCKQKLGFPISNGAFYYFSDECKIGWHKDWEKFFSKRENKENGQDC